MAKWQLSFRRVQFGGLTIKFPKKEVFFLNLHFFFARFFLDTLSWIFLVVVFALSPSTPLHIPNGPSLDLVEQVYLPVVRKRVSVTSGV